MDLPVTIPRRLVQDHRHAPQEENLARLVGRPQPLLEDRPGLDPPARLPLAHQGVMQRRGVLADDEGAVATGDPEDEVGGAEVAVRDPQILRRDGLEDLIQQRPLLGMAVLAEDGVDGQHPLGVEDDQGVTGQGRRPHRPQLLDAVLGPGQVVAIEDFGAIARQERRQGAPHGGDDRGEPLVRLADQGGGDRRLDAVDLAVESLERDADRHGVLLIGGVDRRLDAANDQAHQFHDRGEQEFACILPLGHVFEELIDDPWTEGILHRGLSHDGDGITLGEPFKDIAVDHHRYLPCAVVTPWKAIA
jgi:hypothetical protein